MNWHYEKNGIRHDGITEEEMTERVKRGELTASTLVWQPGMPDWQPLSTTPLTARWRIASHRQHCRGTAFRVVLSGHWLLPRSLATRLNCGRRD